MELRKTPRVHGGSAPSRWPRRLARTPNIAAARRFLVSPRVYEPGVGKEAVMQIVCPIDGESDSVRKVADLVSSGRVSGRVSRPDQAGDAGDLAARLAPPPEPTPPHRRAFRGFFGVIALFTLAFLAATIIAQSGAVTGEPIAEVIGVAVCSGAFAAAALAAVARDRRGYFRRWDAHERAKGARDGLLDRWEALYYCQRHDVIFYRDPATGEVKQSRDMLELASM